MLSSQAYEGSSLSFAAQPGNWQISRCFLTLPLLKFKTCRHIVYLGETVPANHTVFSLFVLCTELSSHFQEFRKDGRKSENPVFANTFVPLICSLVPLELYCICCVIHRAQSCRTVVLNLWVAIPLGMEQPFHRSHRRAPKNMD